MTPATAAATASTVPAHRLRSVRDQSTPATGTSTHAGEVAEEGRGLGQAVAGRQRGDRDAGLHQQQHLEQAGGREVHQPDPPPRRAWRPRPSTTTSTAAAVTRDERAVTGGHRTGAGGRAAAARAPALPVAVRQRWTLDMSG